MKHYNVITALGILLIFVPLQAGWNLQHTGPGKLFSIAFPPGNVTTGYACGANSLFLFTPNSDTWFVRPLPESSGNFNDIIFPRDRNTGYIACDSGNVLKTTDAGLNWQKINVGTTENLNAIFFPSGLSIGYVVGDNGQIWKTPNAGDSWQAKPPPLLFEINDVFFFGPDTGWIVGSGGRVFKTETGGDAWTSQAGGGHTLNAIYGRDSHVWIVGDSNTFFKSFEQIFIFLPETTNLYSVIFPADIDTGFVCGSFGWVAKTNDDCHHWQIEQLTPSYDLFGLAFPSGHQYGWVCGDQEVIFRYLPDNAVEENPSKVNEWFNILINTIQNKNLVYSLSLSEPATVTLSLYNISGQKVLDWQVNSSEKTSHNVKNLPSVSPGVYFLKAEVLGKAVKDNKKIIIMK
jgi:photosystem II stability/assembly factor-like uncharacterized protein